MKRRRNVDVRVKEEVAKLLLENPGYTGRDLKRKAEKSLKRFRYKFTDRTYQNIKAELGPNIKKDNPLDKPWTILSLKNFPISPDAIPILLEIQNSNSIRKVVRTNDVKTRKESFVEYVFTNRQAIWVSRLFHTIRTFYSTKTISEIAGKVYEWARAYSEQERLSEVMKTEVDSAYLDRKLFETHAEGYPYRSADYELSAKIITNPNTWKRVLEEEAQNERLNSTKR